MRKPGSSVKIKLVLESARGRKVELSMIRKPILGIY